MADAALASGAPELALRVADLVLANSPESAPALTARGDALYAMGRRDAAGAAYREAVALDPRATAAQLGLGRTLAASDPKAAEIAFLRVLALEPENLTALNDLGVVRDVQGRSAQAQEAYRLALEVSPESAEVRINLGRSLAIEGRKPQAVSVLRDVAGNPDAARIWRRDLMAALDLAGDGAWAGQALADDALQTRRVLAAASTPEPATVAPANVPPTPSPVDRGKEAARRTLTFPVNASEAEITAVLPQIRHPARSQLRCFGSRCRGPVAVPVRAVATAASRGAAGPIGCGTDRCGPWRRLCPSRFAPLQVRRGIRMATTQEAPVAIAG